MRELSTVNTLSERPGSSAHVSSENGKDGFIAFVVEDWTIIASILLGTFEYVLYLQRLLFLAVGYIIT